MIKYKTLPRNAPIEARKRLLLEYESSGYKIDLGAPQYAFNLPGTLRLTLTEKTIFPFPFILNGI